MCDIAIWLLGHRRSRGHAAQARVQLLRFCRAQRRQGAITRAPAGRQMAARVSAGDL